MYVISYLLGYFDQGKQRCLSILRENIANLVGRPTRLKTFLASLVESCSSARHQSSVRYIKYFITSDFIIRAPLCMCVCVRARACVCVRVRVYVSIVQYEIKR
jgi:hypothetical protein